MERVLMQDPAPWCPASGLRKLAFAANLTHPVQRQDKLGIGKLCAD
jgi:hypothetical protein